MEGEQKVHQVPISIGELRSMRNCLPRTYFQFTNVTDNLKLVMLNQLGYWEWNACPPIEPVTLSKPAELEDSHIKLFSVILKMSFRSTNYHFFEPQCFMKQVFDETSDN